MSSVHRTSSDITHERAVPESSAAGWWRFEPAARRGADIVASLLALLALAPVFVIVALAIKLTTPGPVLFIRTRVGQNLRVTDRRCSSPAAGPADHESERRSEASHGRPFRFWKFRTVVANAEESGPQRSAKDDSFITRVGRILRFARLDETPRLHDAPKGEMAMFGSRPERPSSADRFVENIPDPRRRLSVRPGITDLAQVNPDHPKSIDDAKKQLEQDLEPAHRHRRSVLENAEIVLRTLGVEVGAC